MKKYNVYEFDDTALVEFKKGWDKLDPKAKGVIAENYVKNKLTELGFDVWVPAMNNHRSDLGVLIHGNLERIQVKSATYDLPSKRFRTMLQTRDKNKKHIPYKLGEIDFFIVFCPFVNEFYVIPSSIGSNHYAVNMLPHRDKVIKQEGVDWEKYRNAFELLDE